jgi:cytochrome P450
VDAAVFSMTAFIPGYYYIPTPANRRVWAAVARLQQVFYQAIAKRRAMRAQALARAQAQASADGDQPSAAAAPGVLLDYLLDAHDGEAAILAHSARRASVPGGAEEQQPRQVASAPASATPAGAAAGASVALTDRELLDEGMTFILAGHETTSSALAWTLHLLTLHPEWQERARAQVLAVLGHSRPPTHEDLSRMPLLQCILWESMRVFPPVPLVVREAQRDVDIAVTGRAAPIRVCAGTSVVVPIAGLHHDPELWDAPDTFNPDRFANGLAAAVRHPMAYIPFAAGPRNCIGSQFALLEARLMLAVLLQRLAFAPSPRYEHHPEVSVTVRPKFGMPMLVSPVVAATTATPTGIAGSLA